MANTIGVPIQVTEEGLQYIQQTADALDKLGAAGQTAGQGTDQVSASTEKASSLFKDAADKVMAVQGALGIATQAWKMFDDTMRGGEAVQHATQALDVLSRGSAPVYMNALRAATHGYIDDATLAHDAAAGLSAGLATNTDEMAKLAKIGSTLGEVYMNDAAGGVQAFMSAMETGSTRGLKQLNIDIVAVREEADRLKKSGTDAGDAMRTAMLDQGAAAADKLNAALGDTGNAWDKLMVRSTNSMNDFKDNAAKGFNGIMDTIDLLNSKKVTIDIVWKAITNEAFPGGQAPTPPPAPPPQTAMPANYGTDEFKARYGTSEGMAFQFGQMGMTPGEYFARMSGTWGQSQGRPNSDFPDAGGSSAPNLGYTDAEVNARMSMYSYQSTQTNPLTAGEREGRRNAAGGYNVASTQPTDMRGSDFYALAADSAQRAEAAIQSMANKTHDAAGAAQQMDGYMANVYANAQKVANTSLAQAFGTGGANPIYNEVGGGLAGDAATMRAKLEAQLKKEVGTVRGDGTGAYFSGGGLSTKQTGELDKYNNQLELTIARHDDLGKVMAKSKSITETQTVTFDQQAESIAKLRGEIGKLNTSGGTGGGGGGRLFTKDDMQHQLDAFDDQSKDAINQYKIATGQATPESVKFQDALDKVNKSAATGKISLAEAANEFKTLGDAARNGVTSVSDIEKLMGGMSGTGGTTTATKAGGGVSTNPNFEDARHGGGGKTGMTAFDDVKQGADDTITKVNTLITTIPKVGDVSITAANITVAQNLRITGSYIVATGAALALVAAQKLLNGGGTGGNRS